MPKRAPSPPPPDDEPRYFTVSQPYPLNANWELPADYLTFARWIATCIGTEPLYALLYKPSARGMVLMEINRNWKEHHLLLGEHRWSEFLKRPSDEEKGRVTQIFHSLYSTGRDAQKDGWKRIDVREWWYKDWSPNNNFVHNPYPATHYCETPPEDRTNKALCRPLPVAAKPPPPKAPVPVVGSAAWASGKTGSNGKAWTSAGKGKGKGGPASNVTPKNANTSQGKGGSKPPSATKSTAGVAWNKPIHTSKSTPGPASTSSPAPQGVWGAGPPKSSPSFASSPAPQSVWGAGPPKSSPSATSSPSPSNAWNTQLKSPSTSPPAHPPGIPIPPKAPTSSPGLSQPVQKDANVTITSTSSGSSSSSFDWATEVDNALQDGNDSIPYHYIQAGMRDVKIVSSTEEDEYLYDGLGDPDDPENFVPEWERNIVPTSKDAIAVHTVPAPVSSPESKEEVTENLWAAYDKEPVPDDSLCPTHGILCKKGICQDAKKAVYEKRRRERAAEQAAAAKKNRKKDGRKTSEAGWRSKNNSERNYNPNGRSSAKSSLNGGSRSVSRASGENKTVQNQTPQTVRVEINDDDDADPWD